MQSADNAEKFITTRRIDSFGSLAKFTADKEQRYQQLEVKKSLDVQQTDRTKKQQKRVPQITTRLEQIEKVLDKLYEDNTLGTIEHDRYKCKSIPATDWNKQTKDEYAKLTTERKMLNQRYLALKEEVKEAEQIRKSVYSILRQEQREQQPRRAQDMER